MLICCVPPPPICTGALGAAGRAPPASSAPPQQDGPLAGAGQQGGGALTRTRKTLSISVLCPVPPAARIGASAEGEYCWRASSRAPDKNAETAATAPTTAPLPVAGMPTRGRCEPAPSLRRYPNFGAQKLPKVLFTETKTRRSPFCAKLAFKPIQGARGAAVGGRRPVDAPGCGPS